MPPDTAARPYAEIAPRLSWIEVTPWIVAILVFFFAQEYLALATSVLVMILFAVSLDLLMGYAGVITLGHAMFSALARTHRACWPSTVGPNRSVDY